MNVQTSIFDFIGYKIIKPIRLIELFGGIGAQAKALTNLKVDFEHYKLVEIDKYAVASYNAIHNTCFTTLDITKIKGDDLEIKETNKYEYIMTYSFPCQDLSIAGKQGGMVKNSTTRSGLLWEVERLLNETSNLPQILLMENVPQVHSEKNQKDFDEWCSFLQSKGYNNFWKILNAKDYGIPQNRNRCFMISILKGYYEFPKKLSLNLKLNDMLENNANEKYYLSIKALEHSKSTNFNQAKYNSRLVDIGGISPTLCARFDGAPKFIIQNGRERKFTSKECWRLMGFSDEDFEKAAQVNSNTQLYKQAGNSIVVNVLEEIFKQLI